MILLTMSSHITQDFSSVILAKAIYVAIGFGIGQLIDNFFSQPFIFSNSVKSHPLEIFIVIISGGLLFGAVGMIAAVPTYSALKVIGKEFLSENGRWSIGTDSHIGLNPLEEIRLLDYGQRLITHNRNTFGNNISGDNGSIAI